MEASVRDAESVESVESVSRSSRSPIAASQSGAVRLSAPRGRRGTAGRRSAGSGGGTKTHRRVKRAVIPGFSTEYSSSRRSSSALNRSSGMPNASTSPSRAKMSNAMCRSDTPPVSATASTSYSHASGPGPARRPSRTGRPALAPASGRRALAARRAGPADNSRALRATRHNERHDEKKKVESRPVTRTRWYCADIFSGSQARRTKCFCGGSLTVKHLFTKKIDRHGARGSSARSSASAWSRMHPHPPPSGAPRTRGVPPAWRWRRAPPPPPRAPRGIRVILRRRARDAPPAALRASVRRLG